MHITRAIAVASFSLGFFISFPSIAQAQASDDALRFTTQLNLSFGEMMGLDASKEVGSASASPTLMNINENVTELRRARHMRIGGGVTAGYGLMLISIAISFFLWGTYDECISEEFGNTCEGHYFSTGAARTGVFPSLLVVGTILTTIGSTYAVVGTRRFNAMSQVSP